jgi:hypothetical protein
MGRLVIGSAFRRRVALMAVFAAIVATMGMTSAGATVSRAERAADQPYRPRPDHGKLTPRLDAEQANANHTTSASDGPGSNTPDNQPGGLQRTPDGQVIVDVLTTDTTDGTQRALRKGGATIIAVGQPGTNTITASVQPASLESLSELPQVTGIREVPAPAFDATCAPIVSQGDKVLKADVARLLYNVDGTGVQIGTISDSYNTRPGAITTAPQDVTTGELPGTTNPCSRTTPVNLVQDQANGTDEGRAMMETEHSLAPGSPLSFATAAASQTQMASNITALRTAGAKVIADDVNFFDDPIYQEGPISVAIDQARAAGIAYFTSAGNQRMTDNSGKEIGSYEAKTYRGTTCPTLPSTYLDCHNFNPGAGTASNSDSMTLGAGSTLTIYMGWANALNNVTTDYDLFLLDSAGNVLASSTNNNGTTKEAYESYSYKNPSNTSSVTVRVVVARNSGSGVRFKFELRPATLTNVQWNTSTGDDVIGPTIYGHHGAANAFSVAAAGWTTPSTPESYTSRGPVTMLFNPTPSTTALASPQVINKPDFTAVDCVSTTFFGNFCGTSDAAPHAAAVAALLFQAKPSLTPAQIGTVLSNTAIPVGTATPDVVGAGLIQADAAVGSVAPCTQTLTGAQGPTYMSGGGKWCVSGATFSGSVSVAPGTRAVFVNSTINGTLAAKNPNGLVVCGTTITGTLAVGASNGFVLVGDPGDDGCAANNIGVDAAFNGNTAGLEVGGNTIGRNLTLQSNSGTGPFDDTSIEIEANTIAGNLGCVSNSSVTNDGQPNTVTGGRYSQCSAAGF